MAFKGHEQEACGVWAVVKRFPVRVPSAGVGRTGVFITLSIVLERMRYEGAVDIFQTVKMLRTQRPAMVQTEVSTEQPDLFEREETRRYCKPATKPV